MAVVVGNSPGDVQLLNQSPDGLLDLIPVAFSQVEPVSPPQPLSREGDAHFDLAVSWLSPKHVGYRFTEFLLSQALVMVSAVGE